MSDIGNQLNEWIKNKIDESLPLEEQIENLIDDFFQLFKASIEQNAIDVIRAERKQTLAFIKRNLRRWKNGFYAYDRHISLCREAGQDFQSEFTLNEKYKNDLTFGTLMRLHARGIRIASEIGALMKSGFPDGAMSRWRSLYELGLSSLAISRLGYDAALDYFICGQVKKIDGMRAFNSCAERMGYEKYDHEKLKSAKDYVEKLLSTHKKHEAEYSGDFGWLRPHINSGKRDKVEEFLSLNHWRHDYKWASQDVHSGFRDDHAPLGMSEAIEPMLLAGTSNSGMTDPAHRSAIAISWITCAFTNHLLETDDYPFDRSSRIFWTKLIDQSCQDVGEAFISNESEA